MKRRISTLSFFLFLVFLLTACGPKITTNISKSLPVTAYDREVTVVALGGKVPVGYTKIGDVYAGESGFTMKCNYPYMMQRIKEECRKIGGTLIHITEHKTPDLWSSCHRIRADIYADQNN